MKKRIQTVASKWKKRDLTWHKKNWRLFFTFAVEFPGWNWQYYQETLTRQMKFTSLKLISGQNNVLKLRNSFLFVERDFHWRLLKNILGMISKRCHEHSKRKRKKALLWMEENEWNFNKPRKTSIGFNTIHHLVNSNTCSCCKNLKEIKRVFQIFKRIVKYAWTFCEFRASIEFKNERLLLLATYFPNIERNRINKKVGWRVWHNSEMNVCYHNMMPKLEKFTTNC